MDAFQPEITQATTHAVRDPVAYGLMGGPASNYAMAVHLSPAEFSLPLRYDHARRRVSSFWHLHLTFGVGRPQQPAFPGLPLPGESRDLFTRWVAYEFLPPHYDYNDLSKLYRGWHWRANGIVSLALPITAERDLPDIFFGLRITSTHVYLTAGTRSHILPSGAPVYTDVLESSSGAAFLLARRKRRRGNAIHTDPELL